MVSQKSAIDTGLKAISDTTRRGILALLKGRQLSVLEIAEEFPMSRPAISKHLRILKEAGLVLETPAGRQRLYSLEAGPLDLLRAWLAGFNGDRGRSARRPAAPSAVVRGFGSVVRPPAREDDWRVW
jgi:DNA-binding transcriptional ArsR family regulator